ncbi:peregrin [Copidosoma floridanum]|uniref:peregrin n=1 Tax=Copidosoma floridanum TaxID=29053 RepID=UPI0006C9C94B|nr:peregrin [Copidosoma floridanum]
MRTPSHSSRKKSKNRSRLSKQQQQQHQQQQKIETKEASPGAAKAGAAGVDALPVQESNKYAVVIPWKEDVTKPVKLQFTESISILPQDGCVEEEKSSPHKNTITISDREKEDKAILSSLPVAVAKEIDGYEKQIGEAEALPNSYVRFMERSGEELDGEVEYDLDEEDSAWLAIVNERRAASGLPNLEPDVFELLMDRLEKESYFQQQSNGGSSIATLGTAADEDAVCCICMDGECQNSNAILFCDMCNLAVHQDCYGVPYIPEGQWLCRRCLQSPSRAVDCALCPNRGGAFKQTDQSGTWAHVVCALWIPEVRFANTVFLEPIDSIESIPAARWRLVCCVCKRRNVGACIQCHKSNCYAAFHVTCAQQAGLCMRMRTVQPTNGEPMLVQKTAYCETHSPPDYQPNTNPTDARRRAIANKKSSSAPVISIPTIPPERIREIASLAEGLPKKNQLMQRLIAYWTLKRQYRNGVPLLRRLQSSHPHPRAPPSLNDSSSPTPDSELREELGNQLKYWQCLRQDLERARLLCELVRKREKLKKELFKVKEKCMWFELRPLDSLLKIVIELLKLRDPNDIFGQPVNIEEVPDYLDIVTHPMDLSTIEAKIDSQEYDSISAFESDFNLMVSNCLAYNRKDTMFYRAGVKMREQGSIIIEQAKKNYPEFNGSNAVEKHVIDEAEQPQQQNVTSTKRKRERSSRVRNDSETVSGDKETLSSSALSISPGNTSNANTSGTGSALGAVSGGVNRRTAVLFTRKAKARQSRGPLHRASPENEQKKQSDSFRVYRSGGTDSDVGERDSQSSSCSSCSTSRSTSLEREDDEMEEDEVPRVVTVVPNKTKHTTPKLVSNATTVNKMEIDSNGSLTPLQLVWAKCRGYPWYPALIIDPNTPKGTVHRGVPIPSPPEDVLALKNNHKELVHLVLFFDTKRTWQWLPGEKLEPLGVSQELDDGKLIESRKPTDRKAVKKAYQDALLYQKQTTGSSTLNSSASD